MISTSVVTKTIAGESQGFDIVCDDELTLVGMEGGKVKVLRNNSVDGVRRRRGGVFNCFHTMQAMAMLMGSLFYLVG